jgi:hypothetical protein
MALHLMIAGVTNGGDPHASAAPVTSVLQVSNIASHLPPDDNVRVAHLHLQSPLQSTITVCMVGLRMSTRQQVEVVHVMND